MNFSCSLPGLTLISDPRSPLQHLVLSQAISSSSEREMLEQVVEICMQQGIAITQARYIDKFERTEMRPR